MKRRLLVAFVPFLITGCATMFDGGSAKVSLKPSQGKNVKVRVIANGNEQLMEIPAILTTKKSKEDIYISVVDDCFAGADTVVQSDVNPYAFLNIFANIFGLTGTTVDMSSGNAWEYDEHVVVSTYKKDSCKK